MPIPTLSATEPPPHRIEMSPDEYVRFDRTSPFKYEFDGAAAVLWNPRKDGMPGVTLNHNRVCDGLRDGLKKGVGAGWEVFDSDVAVAVPSGRYFYPDLSVVRSPPVTQDSDGTTLLEPVLLAEVLSPSTAAFDRVEKFAEYEAIDGLRVYLLLSQTEPLVESFARPSGTADWTYRRHLGINAVLPLRELAVEVPLADVYSRLDGV